MSTQRRTCWIVLFLLPILVCTASGQLSVCDGRNHQNTATTGSWGLPSARTLGIQFAPASQVVVERIEWFYAASSISPTLGGTISIILEDSMTGLPSTNPANVVAQAQWSNSAASGWHGATFANPHILQSGVNYWLTTTASPTLAHQAPAYNDAGPDATPFAIATGGSWFTASSTHNFKVRILATVCTLPVEYQVNQPQASADINGVMGTPSTPAVLNLSLNDPATLNRSSSLTGPPWDILFGSAPLVPASAGGITLPDGQFVNIDLTDPGLSSLFTPIFNGPPLANNSVSVNTSSSLIVSFQMGVLDASSPTGVRLSQPNRIVVQ